MTNLRTDLIIYEDFALADVVAIVDESCQNSLAETEILIVILKHASKTSILHIVLKLHPNRVFGIVEENRWRSFSLTDDLLVALFILSDHRHNTIRP